MNYWQVIEKKKKFYVLKVYREIQRIKQNLSPSEPWASSPGESGRNVHPSVKLARWQYPQAG
jgi:hypothetical protein